MQTLKRLLPGLEAGQLVSRAPALLGSTQLEEIVPRRMAAISNLLPGVDVHRWAIIIVRAYVVMQLLLFVFPCATLHIASPAPAVLLVYTIPSALRSMYI